jgi:hypothetical protein
MAPAELYWLVDARSPPKMIGDFPEDQANELIADAWRVLKAQGAEEFAIPGLVEPEGI